MKYKNIPYYIYEKDTINSLSEGLRKGYRIYFIDPFFKDKELIEKLPLQKEDILIYVDISKESSTDKIDEYKNYLVKMNKNNTSTIIGIGGGATLDSAKAEAASRTCVMTNLKIAFKVGMNSDYTIDDQFILDLNLIKTVPKEQYFSMGMDTYIHSFESLNVSYRDAVGDAFAREAISLCEDVFNFLIVKI